MVAFPYVQTAGKSLQVFEAIRNRGNPPKVTRVWLESAGFKSKNDRGFVGVLKFLGVTEGSGVPTELYDSLKRPEWKANLASIIRDAYEVIFSDYQDAQLRNREQLIDQFRPLDADATQRTLELKVSTFLSLCDVADFSSEERETATTKPPSKEAQQQSETKKDQEKGGETSGAQHLTININLSLEIPAVDNTEVYDDIFKAMAKHLSVLMSRSEV